MDDEATGEEEEEPPQPIPPLQEEEVEQRLQLFKEIFEESPAEEVKNVSLNERRAQNQEEDFTLTYGEVDFATINHIVTQIKTTQQVDMFAEQGIFLDLGSGAGKACIAAALVHPFQRVVGVEILQSLCEVSNTALAKYQELLAEKEGIFKTEVEFVRGNFAADFASIVEPLAPHVAICLAVATCFGEEQLEAMALLAERMPDNSIFVTFTQELPDRVIGGDKKLPGERYCDLLKEALTKRGTDPATVTIDKSPPDTKPGGWRNVHREEVQLSFGTTTMFIFRRIPLLVPEEEKEEAVAFVGAPTEV